MKKYGFECEYWVFDVNNLGTPIIVPKSLPSDECGFLAEVRGEPHSDPLTAAYLFLAEEDRTRMKASNFVAGKCILSTENPTRQLTPEFKREALRRFGKGAYPHERGNLWGKDYSPRDKMSRAGLHVHFSDTKVIEHKRPIDCRHCGKRINETLDYKEEIPQQQDMVKIIQTLDRAFASQIKEAKRIPGCYELKTHGFEYRSLPASVSVVEVAKVIQSELIDKKEVV